MDDLSALRLQAEWGADEALGEAPVDRFVAAPARPAAAAAAAVPRPALLAAAQGQSLAQSLADRAGTLDELHAALQAFDGCALRATATHTVRPDGAASAGVVLIGEAPGADDDRSGRAFSGEPGQTLDRVLRSIGLDRSGVLLTTLAPWRPPGSRPLAEAEAQACLPFLLRLLALAQPRRVELLGAAPVRALTGAADNIRRLRGRWQAVAVPGLATPVPALPMLPLELWLRTPDNKRAVWADLLELRQRLDAPPA